MAASIASSTNSAGRWDVSPHSELPFLPPEPEQVIAFRWCRTQKTAESVSYGR